jgi:hypothetical protein
VTQRNPSASQIDPPRTDPAVAADSGLFRCDDDGRIVAAYPGGPDEPGPALAAVHAALHAFVEHGSYPCVGAKAAVARHSYVLGIYPALDDAGSAAAAAADARWFAANASDIDDSYATFLAVFRSASIPDDASFEVALWAYLQAMHRADPDGWDPSVSSDPSDPGFRFSVGGSAFFVIGMHPNASREARRFPFPTIVFNLHSQFETLREQGRFEKMRTVIREREEALAGEPNPLLADFGASSEAAQYAGLSHPAGWKPPFTPEPQDGVCPMRAARTPGAAPDGPAGTGQPPNGQPGSEQSTQETPA